MYSLNKQTLYNLSGTYRQVILFIFSTCGYVYFKKKSDFYIRFLKSFKLWFLQDVASVLKWCILVLQNNVEDAQEAFDAFFAHYPYCYGYWKKYADILKKNGDVEKAIEVSRRLHSLFIETGNCNEWEEQKRDAYVDLTLQYYILNISYLKISMAFFS